MSLVRRISNLFRRSELEREIDAELQSHLEMRTADNVAKGMSPQAARRDALLRFGNPQVMKERATAMDIDRALDALGRDLHYSLRQLRRSPSFTFTAAITLALGIGANVVVFSVLNALILRPLDVPQPSGLYNVVQGQHGNDNESYPAYLDYKQRNSTFSDIAAYRFLDSGLSTGGAAYKCWFYEVSGNYFDMLGVQPLLGRFFHTSDERGPSSAPYIVLGENFWRNHFQSDPKIIGTSVEVNSHPFTIVGIAPESFHGTDLFLWPDFWIPLVDEPQVEGFDLLSKRSAHGIWILGRLKPGISVQQATDNLNAISAELSKQYPASDDGLKARLVQPGLMGDVIGDPTRVFLLGIMALAFLVLLAACTNLASVFAARAADRARELAIRLAIGSSKWHVLRQLLMEAVLISLLGGALGSLISTILLKTLSRWQPFAEFPVHVTVNADLRVYAVALLLSIGSGILFGLLPGRQVWRTSEAQVIKGAVSDTVLRRFSLRDILLAVQIAICTLLVTSSLVAVRGMQRSLHAPLGFQPEGTVLAETDMHMAGHSGQAAVVLRKRMLDEIAQIPGVTAVGLIDDRPLGAGGSSTYVWRQGTKDFRTSQSLMAPREFSISPGYLHAAGTHLLAGRDFTWHDAEKAPKVALVNEKFARVMFPNSSAVGEHFMTWSDESWEIVGVVEDGKYEFITEDQQPAMFFPIAQQPSSDTALVVRSQLPATDIEPAVYRSLAAIDPNLPFTIHPWPEALEFMLFPAQAATASLGVMGLLAAMLAVTGVFGMAAYSVSRRIKELGIRVALGAQRLQLIRSALARPLALLLVGSSAGLLLGVVAAKLLAQIVYEATSRDPVVLAGVVVAMALLGSIAVYVPARHVLAIDPARLLREE